MTPKEAEDFFTVRSSKKGLRPDHKDKVLPGILDSIKEDLPIVKFFEKVLEFEAKVRKVQDEYNQTFANPDDADKNATQWFNGTLSIVFSSEIGPTNQKPAQCSKK